MMNRKDINIKSESATKETDMATVLETTQEEKEKRPIMKRELKHLKILVHI